MGTQTKTLAEQVANGIMNLIQETPYKAGDKLPTEKELCERTGAGRNTVREALKILASRNVLSRFLSRSVRYGYCRVASVFVGALMVLEYPMPSSASIE